MTLGMHAVTLEWQGAQYTIPADNLMPVIEEVESILERHDSRYAVQILVDGKGPSLSKLAMAFGAMLRHAGAAVSDQEVFLAMQKSIAAGDPASLAAVVQAYAMNLLATISPPMHAAMQEADDDTGKSEAAES